MLKKLFLSFALAAAMATPAHAARPEPLVIQEQGSFAVGGTVMTQPGAFDPKNPGRTDGQTFHGDHAYVTYQKPVSPRKYPLVMLHGSGQFSKTWGTTPDGREGFQNIFLRRNFSVYLLDQPRRGNAGRSMVAGSITPTPDEQFWFGQFRVGHWPNPYPGSQFPMGEESLNQYFRQMTPNTGPFDMQVISDAVAALHDAIGPSVLLTHSQGGGPGWLAAMKSANVKGIVAYEPGSNFFFPEGEVPAPIENKFAMLSANAVPMNEFMKLTRIPIIIYYGDNIPENPSDYPDQDYWRAALSMARTWEETVNKYGGDVTVLPLPEAGLRGNTHFPFSDLNNVRVADHLSAWMKEKKLD